jgi:hypothetical protein
MGLSLPAKKSVVLRSYIGHPARPRASDTLFSVNLNVEWDIQMRLNPRINSITPFAPINKFIESYTLRLLELMEQYLVGIYLTGSLSYGDFDVGSSDIDITNITTGKLSQDELRTLEQLHDALHVDFPEWAARFECTYTPVEMLSYSIPPGSPRPWYNGIENHLYKEAPYGNEWVINNYLLYESSITLAGIDFKNISAPISIREVQKACVKDFQTEWRHKIYDKSFLGNDHYTSYFVLNLCRILYTIFNARSGTKKQSSEWVKSEYPKWEEVIVSAQNWKYGKAMIERDKIKGFAGFIFNEIENSDLYKSIYPGDSI